MCLRRRLEDRGAALSSLRTAMRSYHAKVSDRLSALERCLQQLPESQTERREALGSPGEEGTPTQDADAAAGTPEAKRLRR